MTEDQEVREGIVNAFQHLLSEEPGWRADIEGLHLNRLNSREVEVLELPFTEEEIHSALMEMNGDKASGPNGFTLAFWQACWEFVKEEMWICLKSFMIKDLLPKALIPPSWSSSLRKEVLANRLKKVLEKVVSVDQNAFVRGKQILDALLIGNEVIDFWHKRKEKGLICKLDIEKAYDSINWNFLMKTSGRGEMEMIVSHLLFAVDTIIFYEARKEQLTALSWILAWFEVSSGLRINLAKSVLIPVGEVEEIEEMAMELGCKVGSLPTVYLGLPLGAHHKAISMWDGVEERMRRRLAQWKRQYISKGGRLERKVHLINWEVVCTQKEKGGLGIGKIDPLNKALLEGFGWRTKEARGTFGVGVWKEIMKEANWCWDSIKFKNATVNEVWDSSLGQGGWNLRFSRDFNDWELDLIRDLLNMLRDFRISSEEDSVLWKRGGHGIFGVKDAYNMLVVPNAFAFPIKCIWVDKVPTKVDFFAWETMWGKILTLDRLKKWG
ncbi:LINE-1 reverse transcriptase-like [Vitis vinifera]|uniref:LINE-1 reverse transcriptase-like n=1 Tax=Vitis vinifera TaxID=29760 RepID=A0A438BZ20_VITVI|nr:LINE-1 reverse transcriptase-like [Vitis vinifera]